MILFVVLVSTSFSVGSRITHALDPLALTFVRFVMACVVFALICVVAKVKLRFPTWGDSLRYAWLAFLLVLFFTTMFEGLRRSSAFSIGVVFTLAPLFTAAISWLVLKQRLAFGQWISLLLAGLGSLWVVSGADIQQLHLLDFGDGERVFFWGTLAYASYAPSVRLLNRGESLVFLTFWTTLYAAIMLGVYSLPVLLSVSWASVAYPVWLGIAHLVIACTAVTFYLIQYASLKLPSAKVMAYVYVSPICVSVYEALMGGSWPALAVWQGVALMVLAMVYLQTSGSDTNKQ